MASDAKPDSPPAADPPAADDDAKDADPEPEEKEKAAAAEGDEPQAGRKRRRRKKGEAAAEKEKEKPVPATPTVERPSRERKTVERYSELAPRVTPAKKSPAILQGSGSKLKDIPNVQFKLSKRKVDENLQSLHVLMYGRKSNAHFLKRNISQFSGFVWTDNQEKQRARIKEKLDKFNKEKLLDFCEILDVYVCKATTKKEEVSAKLLEFLESPSITRDVVLTDEKKGKKRRRRSKGNGQATEGASEQKKRRKSRKQSAEAAKENDDEDDEGPAGSEDASIGEEDDEDSEAKDNVESDEEPVEPPAKKTTDDKQTKKAKEKDASGRKASTKPAKGASKPSQDIEDEPEAELESKKVGKKVSKSSKESDVTVDKANKKVSKSKKDEGKEGQSNNSGASNNKARKKDAAKTSNKNKGKGKGNTEAGAAPTTEELHAVVSDILKEVDFNTATLADILRQLGTHFKMDLMDRKSEVKHIIEEVINSMSDDEEGEEENAEEDVDKNTKEENSKEDGDGEIVRYFAALHWASSSRDSYLHGERNSVHADGVAVHDQWPCSSLHPNVPTNPSLHTPEMTRGQEAAAVVELGVKRGEPSLVAPDGETKRGLYYLSNLDQNIAVIVQTVYCFAAADGAAAGDALRESLSRVLVHYYPLAGRLTLSGEGKLIVDCTGEGAVFVDAVADCAMADVGDITRPDPSVLGELVYSVPGAKNVLEMPLLAAQVTKFKCGGFVLGLAINHCMFDGVGAMQFVNSWGETARGVPLSVPPALDRAVLRARDPPVISFDHHEFEEIPDVSDTAALYGDQELMYCSFCFDPDRLERVRGLALSGGELGGRCTTFEALSGLVWRARTRALGLVPEQRTKLLFAVDGRRRFEPPLPRGYFGNGIVLTNAVATAGELLSSPPSRAAGLVQEAVRMVTDEYMRSAVDYFEATRARPSLASTLLITAWSRLPFRAADFGWGPPAAYGPAALPEREVALFLSCAEEGGGVRVLLGLPAAAMAEFERLVEEVIAS
ncbi:hypothetical protein E2562_016701 [Oryza meyeriana var. granulata]|uniref:DEK-C domain-containing protein n=1 Tax=Oryza meyeriana var. granulata TaxID=110450 RepID=A0A6G1EL10_9ORYZ|nr:hypothetical protein E2562_016701 [Oryza meyeriana var. granulata]